MRILIKGGVWKNTEDEILKAAVMKYGKCQWARVASLLSRKSAAQCKARWYEWLDPSIKKIEWSREEEEKLLHLAKLMPNQWRTIAPIVGRTAGQCMEHYEFLLDQAQEVGLEGSSGGGGGAGEDARRLRPGEIDPAPETKPARPDPIDMDEDEKEMLAEARARLANTKGKKAKRKARERQMEEARRLSSLQKRRELKAAGIESRLVRGNKRKYIDYTKEIPFQKAVPAGFYDVSEEDEIARKTTIDPATQGMEISKLEGRHEKEEEDREREKDKKRLKTLFKANAAQAVVLLSEKNDPTALRRRSSLNLPAPQVSDAELEDIVKTGQQAMAAALMPPPSSGAAGLSTQDLVGDYSKQFLNNTATPLRTPMQENVLLQEARNQRILREMTPFESNELEELEEGTGFEGVAPRTGRLATPNTVLAATPSRGGGGGGSVVGATPAIRTPGSVSSNFSSITAPGGGKYGAPLRDHLGLNERHSDSFSVATDDVRSVAGSSVAGGSSSSSVSALRADKLARENMSRQLRSLPAPEYEYQIALPASKDEEVDGGGAAGGGAAGVQNEDAADVERRLLRQAEENERRRLACRSSVLKRELPRPVVTSSREALEVTRCFGHDPTSVPGFTAEELSQAGQLIGQEMLRLMTHDSLVYPIEKQKVRAFVDAACGEDPTALEGETPEAMAAALALIRAEARDALSSVDMERFNEMWLEAHAKMHYLPSRGPHGAFGIPENKAEMVQALSNQFAAIRARIEKDSKKSAKVESKLKILTAGYAQRGEQLRENGEALYTTYVEQLHQLAAYRELAAKEDAALKVRKERALVEMQQAEELEAEQQRKYAELTARLQELAGAGAAMPVV